MTYVVYKATTRRVSYLDSGRATTYNISTNEAAISYFMMESGRMLPLCSAVLLFARLFDKEHSGWMFRCVIRSDYYTSCDSSADLSHARASYSHRIMRRGLSLGVNVGR